MGDAGHAESGKPGWAQGPGAGSRQLHTGARSATSGFVPAALALAQVELALLRHRSSRDARDALRRVAGAVTPGPPELLLALGRVERAAGSLDSAARRFRALSHRSAPNRALGLLELARTRLALGRAGWRGTVLRGCVAG